LLPTAFESPISLLAILPEIILLAGGCGVLLLAQVSRESVQRSVPVAALLTIGAAIAVVVVRAWSDQLLYASGNGLIYDALAVFARNSTLVLGAVITLVAWNQPVAAERGEFWSMTLFTLAGVLFVGASNDLLMLFVAVELVSVPTYVLVALSRRNLRALEAATKYFYLGAASAAIMAYGFAFLYGVAGSSSLPVVAQYVTEALQRPGTLEYAIAAIGVTLSLGGLLFKVAAVPLHFYIADVYQGAASPVAGLLGFVPKFAGFLAIFKIVSLTGHWINPDPAVFWLLWAVGALSMTIGNVLALMQTNVKRLLAYSGVAHAGYMMVGVMVGPEGAGRSVLGDGTAAVLFYMVIYGIANLAAFAVLGVLRVRGEPCETQRDLAGLLRRHPGLALIMGLAMLTLMGLPPTAGFWGKLTLFGGALNNVATGLAPAGYETWLVVLVVIALLNSALAAAYYLRVIAAVLLYEDDRPAEAVPNEAQHVGVLLCAFLLLVFTFFPTLLLEPGRRATSGMRGEGYVQTAPLVSETEAAVAAEAGSTEPGDGEQGASSESSEPRALRTGAGW
jgi:NADH-quinone oxidoreductase subunit N